MLISTLDALFIPAKVIPVYQNVSLTSGAAFKSQHAFLLSSPDLVATSALMIRLVIFLYRFMLMPTAGATHSVSSGMSPQHQ